MGLERGQMTDGASETWQSELASNGTHIRPAACAAGRISIGVAARPQA